MNKLIIIIYFTCSVLIANTQPVKQQYNSIESMLKKLMKIDGSDIQYSLSPIKEVLTTSKLVSNDKVASTVFVLFSAIVNQTKDSNYIRFNLSSHEEITRDVLLQSKPFLLNVINTSNDKIAVTYAYSTLGLTFPNDQQVFDFFLNKFFSNHSDINTKIFILGSIKEGNPYSNLILKYALQSQSLSLVGNAACNPIVISSTHPSLLDDLIAALFLVDEKAELTNYKKKKLTYRFLVNAILKYPNRYKYKDIIFSRFKNSKNKSLMQLIENLSEKEILRQK